MAPQRLQLESYLPYRLSILSNRVSSTIAKLYATQFGISIPQWRVIAVLGRYQECLAVQLVDYTQMDKVAVSRAVKSLLDNEFIKGEQSSDDRRKVHLTLTEKGKSTYNKIVPLVLDYETQLLDSLSSEQKQSLDDILSTLAEQALEMDQS